jgi:hypothetical protein
MVRNPVHETLVPRSRTPSGTQMRQQAREQRTHYFVVLSPLLMLDHVDPAL